MADAVDQNARDKAGEALHAVNNLRMETKGEFALLQQKLDTTHAESNTKIDKIESAIKWAGGLIVSLVLSVLAWAVLQQINANESQKKEMAQQIQLLQSQERARVEARSEILERLPPRAPEPTDTTVGGR
jgi:hypothetical protein